ncbi:hypothetical protein EK21DRAFT_88097 [Setomelanomma holmii]|uniref:Uncharacterized protein n=1 Tax=Setomelanomma holmii TaxID=210430 RepID=A0A9P4HD24_9PLEO|nr:hypothetical protein EK21DRAFT_88097 [Setomelanomma holmii]
MWKVDLNVREQDESNRLGSKPISSNCATTPFFHMLMAGTRSANLHSLQIRAFLTMKCLREDEGKVMLSIGAEGPTVIDRLLQARRAVNTERELDNRLPFAGPVPKVSTAMPCERYNGVCASTGVVLTLNSAYGVVKVLSVMLRAVESRGQRLDIHREILGG